MDDGPIPLHTLLENVGGDLDRALAASKSDRAAHDAVDQAWPFIKGAANVEIGKALDTDLVGALVDGWSTASELDGYTDPVRYPASKTVTMTLGRTTSAITVDPELTLVVGEAVRQKLALVAEFLVTLQGVVLTIRGGQIIAVALGKAALQAKLKWGKHETPLKLKTHEIDLGGSRAIDPPVTIPRPAPRPG